MPATPLTTSHDITEQWSAIANPACPMCKGLAWRTLDFGREVRACPVCIDHPIMRVSSTADERMLPGGRAAEMDGVRAAKP